MQILFPAMRVIGDRISEVPMRHFMRQRTVIAAGLVFVASAVLLLILIRVDPFRVASPGNGVSRHTDSAHELSVADAVVLGGEPPIAIGRGTGMQRPILVPQAGHSVGVDAVGFSRNGKTILTGGHDGTVVIWDAATGAQIRLLGGPNAGWINAAMFAGVRAAVVAGGGPQVDLYDTATGLKMASYPSDSEMLRTQPSELAEDVDVSPDGKWLAVGYKTFHDNDGWTAGTASHLFTTAIKIWDIQSARAAIVESDLVSASAVAFSPTGEFLIAGCSDGTVRLYDAIRPNRRWITHLSKDGSRGQIVKVASTRDGKRIFAGNGGAVYILDLASGRRLAEFRAEDQWVRAMAVSSDDKVLATAGFKSPDVNLWDAQTGARRGVLHGHRDDVNGVSFSRDGSRILTGSSDGRAVLWDVATLKPLIEFNRVTRSPDLAVASPSEHLLVASGDAVADTWDLETARHGATFRPKGHGRVLTVSRDGMCIVVSHPSGGMSAYQAKTGKELWRLGGADPPARAALSADGLTLFAIYKERIDVWDLQTGHHATTLPAHDAIAVDVSANGQRAVTTSFGSMFVWDVTTGKQIQKRELPLYPIPAGIGISPDGACVAYQGEGLGLSLRAAVTGSDIRGLEGMAGNLTDIIFNGDGTAVLAGDSLGYVYAWDCASGKLIRQYQRLPSGVRCVRWSNDGRYVIAAGYTGIIRLYNSADGAVLCDVFVLQGGASVAIAPDGRFDTDDLDNIRGLHWVFPDDPFRALAPEAFMRDYYEPRLLARVLNPKNGDLGEEFRALRQLQDLNRSTPELSRLRIVRVDHADRVTVSVDVRPGTYVVEGNGSKRWETEAYDLRLFRDGQLVGQCPEPQDDAEPLPEGNAEPELALWRAATEVSARNDPRVDRHPDGSATVRFDVRLPHRPGQTVKFTAYAFNRDRVKSSTVEADSPAAGTP